MSNATDITERTETDIVIPYKIDWFFLTLCLVPVITVMTFFLFANF